MLTLPGRCWLCDMPLAISHWGICSCCRAHLPYPASLCPRCALPAATEACICGRCLLRPPPWSAIVCITGFEPPLSNLIHKLKFQNRPAVANALSRLLLLRILAARDQRRIILPDLILSVPLHRRRLQKRGYNQSALIALALARWLGCTYCQSGLSRLRATTAQRQLSAALRKANLRSAFRVEVPVKGLRIALVDDVVTTGSTIAEICQRLAEQGAADVQIWCLCRTL